MKLQTCLADGYVRIGKRFLVHQAPPGIDWLLFYNPPGSDAAHKVDLRNREAVAQIFDMAVRAYDSLVIDQDYEPEELDKILVELTGNPMLANMNAWLATCWLSAKVQGTPNRGSIKRIKNITREEMRCKVELIYGKNHHEESETPEDGTVRLNGFVTIREFTRQLMKER